MRVKRGAEKNRKHKKVLEQTKGFRLSYSKLYRRAREALLHAKQYSYGHRRKRQGQFRRLWIQRINAGLSEHEMSYSTFINVLKTKNIEINRKILADLALNNSEAFAEIVKSVK
ncbi:MAG: 50S ribosomal protein L20 [Candidatus Dojkabacteria bacterium]|nr:MAG: 50S ribosomal protein L20 [Candidatus Dojkabacteria bacterium]